MYHHPAMPFSLPSNLPEDLPPSTSQALLTEVCAASLPWDHSEFAYETSDMDLPFLACLALPSYSTLVSDTCNMADKESTVEGPPQFTELLATVTAYRRNLDEQVLQENTKSPFMVGDTGVPGESKTQKVQRENSRQKKKGQSVHLWEFVRDLLLYPTKDLEAVRWENRKEGTFRVIRSDTFAQLWGEQKKNKCMNYEKLSRALRHYYKSGILERVNGRLTYKFGRKAHGWKDEPLQKVT
ncbi:ETS-related transcription factor Elf-5 [Xenopus laevis]|uniref:ETS-related transcription factor Elf-5 n=2 Tax=Xenopus laevis TaxID=8355 RepID=A0A1L8FN85_XENLA|nr:ETS-related transcription factor Elf-5 [Xenopus laevis]OCT73062.1 hypothetical protein XELAEV_18036041mg [Xenopus laevis]